LQQKVRTNLFFYGDKNEKQCMEVSGYSRNHCGSHINYRCGGRTAGGNYDSISGSN
jgi:hypothetical protein